MTEGWVEGWLKDGFLYFSIKSYIKEVFLFQSVLQSKNNLKGNSNNNQWERCSVKFKKEPKLYNAQLVGDFKTEFILGNRKEGAGWKKQRENWYGSN